MTTTTRPLVLNVTEAGNLLGVSRSTAYELVRSGELESIKLRRRVVVPVAAVADRLGITVPDVWLAMGRQEMDGHTPVGFHDRLGPEELIEPEERIEDVPEDVYAQLTHGALRRRQSLQQSLETALEDVDSGAAADDVLGRVRGIVTVGRSDSPQPRRT